MREEYDIKNLNPRRNLYAERLKEDQQMAGHYHCHICAAVFPKRKQQSNAFGVMENSRFSDGWLLRLSARSDSQKDMTKFRKTFRLTGLRSRK